jgi:predicted alpha/beta-fold hydrolase
LFEFDDRVTAPLSGYSGAAEYYACCSSAAVLGEICVPTCILTAADDPIVPSHIFEQVRRAPQIALRVTEHGGHVGFIGRRNGDPDRYWLDWRVVDFASSAS